LTDPLFEQVHYGHFCVIGDIRLGSVGMPDIRSPVVVTSVEVSNLFNSMCRCCAMLTGMAA
jgi:hypothetical protein